MLADATRILMQLRQTGRTMQPITDLPYEIGYTVQREVAEALGETVGGWKVAIGPGGVPIAAPLLASTIHGDGVRLDLPADDSIKIETELALRLASDLPPRAVPYTREDIVAAIESVSSAFEIVIPRAGEPPEIPFGFYLADYLGNGATVLGPPTSWTPPPQGCRAQLWLDEALSATGEHPQIDPLASLLAYANCQADQMGGLRAGQIVITGSFTKPHLLRKARSARGQVGELCPVNVFRLELPSIS
uniref:2-keto-4-pentenoate hydratase n=1 Tax=Bosea sp. NBC_00436 TaxID=2969620 RepID=A0A9E7ZRW4_9HYPH